MFESIKMGKGKCSGTGGGSEAANDWGKKEGAPYNCAHGIPLRVWCHACAYEEGEGYRTPDVRTFETGATRDTEAGKMDYEAFLSPLALEVFAEYMHRHRIQSDGSLRDGDNWQKGIPNTAYMKSLWRHFMDLWLLHRGHKVVRYGKKVTKKEALCAIFFNVQGMLHEEVKNDLHQVRKKAAEETVASMRAMRESQTESEKDRDVEEAWAPDVQESPWPYS